MSKYLGGSPPVKPQLWAVDPGRVDPKWAWFWNSLITAWPMWSGGGTTLYGIVGGGADVDATSTGGTFPTWAEGQVGEILTFAQASTQDIILPVGLSIANLQAHSIVAFWRTGGTTAMSIYGEGDSASNNSILVYAIRGDQAENYINYFNRDNGGSANVQFNSNGSGNDYADGNWHLGVAALRSKSATDMTHWVDGVDVTQTDASNGTPGASTIDQVEIGTLRRIAAAEYYDEDLAFVATLNRALVEAEAVQLTSDPWGWLTPVFGVGRRELREYEGEHLFAVGQSINRASTF